MAGTTGLGDDALELVNLLLGTTEGAELEVMLILLFLVSRKSWASMGILDVPSSWRAYGHACPGSCGATRSHASHRGRDYQGIKSANMSPNGYVTLSWPSGLPFRGTTSRGGERMRERHLPSNLLDNVTDEGGALAQVTLGARDTGLDDAGGGFLHFGNRPIISFKVHHPRPPR